MGYFFCGVVGQPVVTATQPWACRRMAALQRHQLLDATTRPGPGACWVIKRLGPAL